MGVFFLSKNCYYHCVSVLLVSTKHGIAILINFVIMILRVLFSYPTIFLVPARFFFTQYLFKLFFPLVIFNCNSKIVVFEFPIKWYKLNALNTHHSQFINTCVYHFWYIKCAREEKKLILVLEREQFTMNINYIWIFACSWMLGHLN